MAHHNVQLATPDVFRATQNKTIYCKKFTADAGTTLCRAQILAKKVSPRAFVDQSHKKGQNAGEVGIEGTTIQAADEVQAVILWSIHAATLKARLTSISCVFQHLGAHVLERESFADSYSAYVGAFSGHSKPAGTQAHVLQPAHSLP